MKEIIEVQKEAKKGEKHFALSDLVLENIEALADKETTEGFFEKTGCHATICQSFCYKNGVNHGPGAASNKCACDLCTGK
ncbi:hypothetical protein M2480_002373 [Parabacteroides sp. PFB2-12]|uniref:hypothetical protein n=1 Tax=unclassified Parabacteroides TaxID=2649774 RepID=UPI002472F93E|nr:MULTISPECIES: hypothetical protein [unclassified Parabacteroides]MDH6343641.1 hypothetical protein [Parabacteroides sp. PM6-13]MDH6391378.1 hypothetical protein [Parabacteroides sp. PFB2-12]